jgi:hypothetical protein
MSDFQLRHFDYMLAVGTLAANSQKLVSLTLDQDSSFIMRGRALHIQSSTPRITGQANLTHYLDQITGPDGEYLSQDLTRFSNECETFGQYGNPLPVRPAMIYPPGGAIQANIKNDGNTDLNGLELYFRGQKLFQPGILPCHTYPERFSTNWFIYNGPRPGNVVPTPGVSMAQKSQSLNNLMQVQGDSDFVLRSLAVGSMESSLESGQYLQLWIQLKDEDGRQYSNVPVHVDVCFGALGSLPFVFPGGSIGTDTGPYHPGLLTPEIYVPANRFLLYDLVRDDSFASGPTVSTIRLAFQGAKVYPL